MIAWTPCGAGWNVPDAVPSVIGACGSADAELDVVATGRPLETIHGVPAGGSVGGVLLLLPGVPQPASDVTRRARAGKTRRGMVK
ncbi:hypothetical protein GCM10010435_97220 [Winogradskya consettensis]|uniref:Uncharacterized protein n=1 Tax=Winogradskya consettensis TaxID=113560 RepID=A0A919T0J0_9ACTN|nr:hypothetical protein Aco04nite_75600 [Actinoplanes consettensis]